MRLLFLACLSPKTGNCTTAERIRSHVEAAGHTCELRDVSEFQSAAEVANLVAQNPPFEGALAIHLFKAGSLLLDIQVPFGVIFGGTDINEDVKVEQKRVVMEQVLQKARFAVAFTDKMKEAAELFLLSQSCKIYVQPQGIKTEAAEKFCWAEFLKNSGVSREDVDDLNVFLLVCGLRRVKDPLYLVEAFSEWHCENPQNVLVIIGPKLSHHSINEENSGQTVKDDTLHVSVPGHCQISQCTATWTRQFVAIIDDKIDPVLTVEVEAVAKSRGLPGPGEEPTGASCRLEEELRCGKQLGLGGHVRRHLGGHGCWGARGGQGHSRECSRGAE
ncbi:glycosyltransferase 1 domain-containing protein 1 isoform X3 [Myripristis murdjan]|uniref:glycosyltransferase 1 domain-containing protein 1 isoform X3 n=1 Tax=Myripristis murdjan TaxID=586833 RepID=UPI001175DFF5|nr:glycosyltransferase 1 domain-containing protein 1 isoform X3 [Myripristis murdjan]